MVTHYSRRLALVLGLPLLAVMLAACGSTPPATFYVLNSISTPPAATGANADLVIGVGPVKIADYLDRPQMVRRAGENELVIDEYHQWAEPLKESLPRLLALNLSTLLQTDQVTVFPWKGYREPSCRVEAVITRFDTGLSGAVVLEVLWTLIDNRNPERARAGRFHNEVSVASDAEPAVLAGAMNEALSEFSRVVAAAIQELAAGPPPVASPAEAGALY
ncbi:MAG: PqiC family protein [Planctomycetota bacterium]